MSDLIERGFIPIAEPVIGDKELDLVTDAVRSGWVSSIGRYVTEFEQCISEACACRYAIAVCNGTSAIDLALASLGIGSGDEVIVPTFTFVATANAVVHVGAKPVFVDSDPSHWCLDPKEVERHITSKTRAIIPVHIYGHPADLQTIVDLAERNHLAVVEDAAEALGSTYRNRPVGAIGHFGTLSFYGSKIITSGEGGMVLTNDEALAERARYLRDHAMDPQRRYWHTEVGYNFRMTNLQAALGVAQMTRLPHFLECKRAIAKRYQTGLEGLPGVTMQCEARWAQSSWWMFTIHLADDSPIDRDTLADRLRQAGIDTRPAFPPLHTMPPYRNEQALPVADRVARGGLSLPSGVSLTEDNQLYIIETIRSLFQAN